MLGVRRLAWPELQRIRKASNAHRTASSEVLLCALSRCSAQESAQVEGIRNLFVIRLYAEEQVLSKRAQVAPVSSERAGHLQNSMVHSFLGVLFNRKICLRRYDGVSGQCLRDDAWWH